MEGPQKSLKDQSQQESAKQDVLSTQTDIDIIMCIRRAIDHTLNTMCSMRLKERPKIEKKSVIKWMGRLRVIKPPDCKYISVITFRHPLVRIQKNEVHGIIVLYFPEDTATMLIRSLGITGNLSQDDVIDGCGEFLSVISGAFKTELVKEGYEELEISIPHSFCANVDELFDYYQDEKFELTFLKNEQKFIQVDIALDAIKKTA